MRSKEKIQEVINRIKINGRSHYDKRKKHMKEALKNSLEMDKEEIEQKIEDLKNEQGEHSSSKMGELKGWSVIQGAINGYKYAIKK